MWMWMRMALRALIERWFERQFSVDSALSFRGVDGVRRVGLRVDFGIDLSVDSVSI